MYQQGSHIDFEDFIDSGLHLFISKDIKNLKPIIDLYSIMVIFIFSSE